ncbi:MAG: sugar ABC transporter substrate-binding protein [Lachnospiraceae bacterium]|nr:sugar ABC transporter substrate-binding protein [Lachnospiraceae bacterium]
MKKRLSALLMCVVMVMAMVGCGSGEEEKKTDGTEAPAVKETKAAETKAPETKAEETKAAETKAASAGKNPNFEYVVEAGTASDVNDYYAQYDIECDITIRQQGGSVNWLGGGDVPLPEPKEKYTIGFAAYTTVDEVGAMYLEGMQAAAKEIGIELLVNDANWDQNVQNQAIEQWILQGVDGVILSPCDFYGIKDALDALEEANIPVVSYDAPPNAGNVDAVVMYDAVEQGRLAGEALLKALQDSNTEMKGNIYYGTLPFKHPNAQTREYGFFSVFEEYPDVKIEAITGEAPEEFYSGMEGKIQADPDMLGAWGLFSSATYGMMQAIAASDSGILLSSVDNDRVILEGIYNGSVLGSTGYSAIEGSRLALMQMVNILNGEEVPGIIYQTNTFVTKDNVETMFEEYYGGATLADFIAGN